MNSRMMMMMMSLVLCLVVVASPLVTAQPSAPPPFCSKMVEFNACSMRANTAVAQCNGLVQSVPTFEYWDCICQQHQTLMQCYALCPDDPNMQDQYQAQQQYKFSTCNYVDELKAKGEGPPKILATTATTATATTKATPGATPTPAVQLPSPDRGDGPSSSSSDGPNNHLAVLDMGDGGAAIQASEGTLLIVLCLALVLY